MCGISGILATRAVVDHTEPLNRMIAAIRHRGPDEYGVFSNTRAGMAHARLSIIDLTGGRQPMTNTDRKVWITFNGEIFNYIELREELIQKGHKFGTRSDTEVILHMYQQEGENCVKRLNGQWAFAIWDEYKQKLFLSRDRLGVRPLYYTQTPDAFLFASEIKALLKFPGVGCELDLKALDQIFTFWVTLPPRTAFRDIKELQPGHSMIVENGQARIYQYWSPTYSPETHDSAGREKQLAEDLLNLLLDATRIRLRSDVPVGAYLSGGLDSTITTALTRAIVGDRLRTFSVSFEDVEFDESPYQREASTFLRTQHTDTPCSYSDIASVFPDVIRHTEQPIIRTAPAPLYLLSKHVRESGFKVVLTGEGADEILGGYDIFKEAKIRRFWGRNLDSTFRPLLLRRLYPYMDNLQRQTPSYLKSFFRVTESDLQSPFFSHLPRWHLTSKLKALFADDVRPELNGCDPVAELGERLPGGFAGWNPFNQAEYLEAMYLLPGYILSSQGDRMAMAHSVEGRYPFLDFRVVEFAAKLPPSLKMKVLDQKHLLKLASNGLIPESIRNRPKQPYRAPDGKSFFGTKVPDYVEELLSPARIKEDGIFSPERVSALVNKFRKSLAIGTKDNMGLIGVLSTQLLLEQFMHHRDQRPTLCNHSSLTKYATLS